MTKAVLFDFDGTLADTAGGIVATEREVLRRLGLPLTSEEQMRGTIGLPLRESVRLGGNVPEELADEAADLYRELFFEYAPKHIKIFDGVAETLSKLAADGLQLAIATSRGSRSLKVILETYAMDGCFCDMVTADDGIAPKPLPDMVLTLLGRMGVRAEDTIVVGDTTFDLDMGSSAGCRTIGVSYGNHSREQLQTSSPDWVVDRFAEIADIIGQDNI